MNSNKNIPFCQIGGFEQKMILLDVMKNGFYLKNRQIPTNLDAMCDTLKAEILKYVPKVTEAAIREGIEYYILHEETATLSVAVFFKAIRSKYAPAYEPRSFDIDPSRRPDFETDTISLLDSIAEQLKNNRITYANWNREYAYLVIRGQINWDAFEAELGAARERINTERVRDYQRPIVDFIGRDKEDLNSVAKELAVKHWITKCIEQECKPSDLLTPLINEQEYQQFRKTI